MPGHARVDYRAGRPARAFIWSVNRYPGECQAMPAWITVPAGQHALLSGALTDALENARPCPRGLSCPQASTRFLSGALTGPWRMPGHASWIIVPAGQHVPRAEAV